MEISEIKDKRIVLDTNILIYTQHELYGEFVTEILQTLVDEGNELVASNIAGFEVLKKFSSNEELFEPLITLINGTPRIPVDVSVLRCAGQISHHLYNPEDKNSYKKDNDSIIAATAIQHDCLLLTANINDFPMPLWSIYANSYVVFDKADGKGKGIQNLFVLESRVKEVEEEKGIVLIKKD
jgi:predicted nucleic acid-binding protein